MFKALTEYAGKTVTEGCDEHRRLPKTAPAESVGQLRFHHQINTQETHQHPGYLGQRQTLVSG